MATTTSTEVIFLDDQTAEELRGMYTRANGKRVKAQALHDEINDLDRGMIALLQLRSGIDLNQGRYGYHPDRGMLFPQQDEADAEQVTPAAVTAAPEQAAEQIPLSLETARVKRAARRSATAEEPDTEA